MQIGLTTGISLALNGLGRNVVYMGNHLSETKEYNRQSIALAWSLEIRALVSINENKLSHAVTLFGAVNKLREMTHMPVWDDLQSIILSAREEIRKSLPEDLFESAWQQGSAMNIDRMVSFAMES